MNNTRKRLAALPLGGVGEIGMNMMVYESDNDMIVVDAGVSFADAATPGVDIVLPDTRYIREHAKKLKAVFITHAHEDHIGAMGYLWDDFEDATVYVSPFARKVLEDKLQQVGHKPDPKKIVTIEEGQRYQAGSFEVEYINMTHSILEMFSLAIRTPHGMLVHTGDYKFDPEPPLGAPSNVKRLEELGKEGVLAMLGDSTSVFTEEVKSEATLDAAFDRILTETENRLFFASFASNTGRLIKMIKMASAHDKKICLIGRTAQKMIQHAKELGYFPASLTNSLVSVEEAAGLPRNKVLAIVSGTQGEPRASLTRLSQGHNIKGLKIAEDDTVLLSSKMIPGNERKILDVINGLLALGAHVIHEKNDDVHVSGHGGRADMRKMYSLLKPQIAVPVHGEEAHLVAQAELAKECGIQTVLPIRNGHKAVFGPLEEGEKPYIMHNTFHHGVNYVDGMNILDEDMWIVSERRKMSFEGIVFASLAVSQETGELMADPVVTSRGLIDPAVQGDLHSLCSEKAGELLEITFADGIIDDSIRADEVVRQAVRKVFSAHRGKKPVVVTQIVEV